MYNTYWWLVEALNKFVSRPITGATIEVLEILLRAKNIRTLVRNKRESLQGMPILLIHSKWDEKFPIRVFNKFLITQAKGEKTCIICKQKMRYNKYSTRRVPESSSFNRREGTSKERNSSSWIISLSTKYVKVQTLSKTKDTSNVIDIFFKRRGWESPLIFCWRLSKYCHVSKHVAMPTSMPNLF